jgi:hypothetical protein
VKFKTWQEALAYGGKQLGLFRANRPADEASRGGARVRGPGCRPFGDEDHWTSGGRQLVPDTTARRPVALVDRLGAPSGQLLEAVNVPPGLPAV